MTIGPGAVSQYLERVHLGPLHAPGPDERPDYDLSHEGARDFLRFVIDPLVLNEFGVEVEEG